MSYVIKIKNQDKFYPSSSARASRGTADENGFVDLEYARVFPTKPGANTALVNWATVVGTGWSLVVDEQRKNLVEIVKVKLVLDEDSQ